MARNHNFFFDRDRTPRARGPAAEKTLMTFLETDVQGSDHVCRDLMDDLIAIEDGSDDQREFVGNAHRVVMDREGVVIEPLADDAGDGSGSAAEDAPGGSADAPAGAPADASRDVASVTADAPDRAAPDGGNESGAEPAGTAPNDSVVAGSYRTGRKHFREVLEDWEAFILDDGTDDLADDALLDDEFV